VPEEDDPALELRGAVIKQLVVSAVMLAVMAAIFYASAGRTDIPRSWLLFGATLVHFTGSTLVVARLNPELISQRLTVRRVGSKSWDEVLMRVCNLTILLLLPAVAGLDVGRYGWSALGAQYAAFGLALMAVSSVLISWSMAVNPYFEPTVRIQGDRGHRVVSTGPYGLVRHPGYLSGILWAVSVPLVVGSFYAFVPVLLYSVLMVLRTQLEDRTLQRELEGYAEYARRVRYRLLPGFW
jgi:protein-S-isoprenylcysteine O-methyltransferase Ste14